MDYVIKTSSKDFTKEMLEDIYGKIVTMCMDKTLQNRPINSVPQIWFKVVDKIKLIKPAATLEDVTRILRAAHKEFASVGSNNISEKELENLKKFKDILVLLITEQKRAPQGCGSVMKHASILKSCDQDNVDPMETQTSFEMEDNSQTSKKNNRWFSSKGRKLKSSFSVKLGKTQIINPNRQRLH